MGFFNHMHLESLAATKSTSLQRFFPPYVSLRFAGANKLLEDMKKMNMTPTSNMYNAITAGYFVEENIAGGLCVLKKMNQANVNPDSMTFSHLISYCECEEDIIKIFSQISDTEPADLESGLYLLQAIQEELHLRPNRDVLNYLLDTCASAKDPHYAQLL